MDQIVDLAIPEVFDKFSHLWERLQCYFRAYENVLKQIVFAKLPELKLTSKLQSHLVCLSSNSLRWCAQAELLPQNVWIWQNIFTEKQLMFVISIFSVFLPLHYFAIRSSRRWRRTPQPRRCNSAIDCSRLLLLWRTKSLTYDGGEMCQLYCRNTCHCYRKQLGHAGS